MTVATPAAIAGIARSALLVELNISTYSGRKQDKRTQEEVTASKGAASKRAASVYKSLFAECKELDAVIKFQASVRQRHYALTTPWSDSGTRIVTMKMFCGTYKDEMNQYEEKFWALVNAFLDKYDTLVAGAAFQLGTLFDRTEYPSREQVKSKFAFDLNIAPLPTAGDFRLDIEAEVQRDLIAQYEKRLQDQVLRANQDAWTRLHTVLSHISDRLTIEEDGTKRTFRDTLVSNADELCSLLTDLNVANDPSLERARARLHETLLGVSPDELRKHDSVRTDVKAKVDKILSDFDWGIADDEAEDE